MEAVDDQRLHLIALNLDKQIGPLKAASMLYRHYGPRRTRLFGRAAGIDPDVAPEWQARVTHSEAFNMEKRRQAQAEATRAATSDAEIVTWFDDGYPQALRKSIHPPPVMYVKGAFTDQDQIAVGVVGSRRATRDYIEFTYELAYRVADMGVTVVSGLARGIDRAAHEGALAAGGRTIAVLGSGVDVIYPSEHAALAAKIASQGALVTFFPMGTLPLPHHFPARNWVIASLCAGVVVVQGSKRSGAMITANFAGALGREVMAVPGHVEHGMSEGPHDLLRDGAHLVTSADDVVRCIDSALLFSGVKREDYRRSKREALSERILERILEGPAEVGELALELGEDIGHVLGALTRLEMAGRVTPLPGGRYRAKSDLQRSPERPQKP